LTLQNFARIEIRFARSLTENQRHSRTANKTSANRTLQTWGK